jgi:hypothetical protein
MTSRPAHASRLLSQTLRPLATPQTHEQEKQTHRQHFAYTLPCHHTHSPTGAGDAPARPASIGSCQSSETARPRRRVRRMLTGVDLRHPRWRGTAVNGEVLVDPRRRLGCAPERRQGVHGGRFPRLWPRSSPGRGCRRCTTGRRSSCSASRFHWCLRDMRQHDPRPMAEARGHCRVRVVPRR